MILKKPYAFLIKHFKLIHLVLSIFLCFIFSYSINIIKFFNAYIANGYRVTSSFNLPETYTPVVLAIFLILSVGISLTLFILLQYKQKPNKIYLLLIIYYGIGIGLYFYLNSTFNFLSENLIAATLSRLIRDLSIIYTIIQLPFIIIMVIRTVGFNLKQFSFESDFKDLELSYKDAEEIEVGLNIDGYKYKRRFRRSLRELKYYIVENKFVVSIILLIVLVIAGYLVYNSISPSYDKRYNIGMPFYYGNYQITIEDALFTRVDYRGETIKDGKYYVVLKTKVSNLLESANIFDSNLIKLVTKNGIKSPIQSVQTYFSDFAKSETTSYIMAKDSTVLAICYELDASDIDNHYDAVISNGTATFRGEIYNKSIFIRLNVEENNWQESIDYKINDNIELKDSFFEGNNFQITGYSIAKRIKYSYENCIGVKCSELINIVSVSALKNRQNNYLINIIGTYSNNNNSKYNSFNKVISTFGKIEYNIDGVVKKTDFINVTPDNYLKGVILEVPGEIFNARDIKFILGTRYNKYIISLS